jgi:hypothetical protein
MVGNRKIPDHRNEAKHKTLNRIRHDIMKRIPFVIDLIKDNRIENGRQHNGQQQVKTVPLPDEKPKIDKKGDKKYNKTPSVIYRIFIQQPRI